MNTDQPSVYHTSTTAFQQQQTVNINNP